MVKIIKAAVRENVQHPGWLTLSLLALTLANGFGEWLTVSEIDEYRKILEVQSTASLIKYLSPVGIAAITRGFLK